MSLNIASRMRLRQRGVSIVEALVALVILSVGMLGIAGLYLLSVQSNRSAQTRTAAVHLINDMGDRIRTNAAAMTSYALTLGSVPPVAAKDCSTANCTPAQVAAYDLRAWYDSAMIALPVGSDGAKPRVGITYTAGAATADPARLVITTGWKEPGSTDELTTSLEVVQLSATP